MKRTLTVLMTLALIGSMAFVGFAGTAAAGGNHHDDGDSSDDRTSAASVTQSQSVSQTNVIEQNASQYADQDATGVDIDEILNGDGDDGDDNADNGGNDDGSAAQAGIQTVTFQKFNGQTESYYWNGTGFDTENNNPRYTLTAQDEFDDDGNPLAADWTYDNQGQGQSPVSATVTNADGTTCTVDVAGQSSGQIEACDTTDDNGDNGDNGDGTDGIEGSTGNQTVNQIVDQDADASNSNAQNADASASAGDILSVLLG